MNSSSLFQIDSVSFRYGTEPVLEKISLDLLPGKFYGIVGPNGCGKTTFLDLLIGCKDPYRGSIRYKDEELHKQPKKYLATQLALVPQEYDTGFGFTVEEIVLMGRHPHIKKFALPNKNDWEKVDQSIRDIGIEELRHRYTNTLSGGQKQRAIVARALAQDTPVLLFDEATSSLDIQYTIQIFNLARSLVRAQKKTVIAVIHNLNLAAAYCDDLIFMKDGNIHSHGPTAEILTDQVIDDIFGVEAQVIRDSSSQIPQIHFKYWDE